MKLNGEVAEKKKHFRSLSIPTIEANSLKIIIFQLTIEFVL